VHLVGSMCNWTKMHGIHGIKTECIFYRVPQHSSCYRIPRRMQAFYATSCGAPGHDKRNTCITSTHMLTHTQNNSSPMGVTWSDNLTGAEWKIRRWQCYLYSLLHTSVWWHKAGQTNLAHWHFINQKCHIKRPGFQPAPPRLQTDEQRAKPWQCIIRNHCDNLIWCMPFVRTLKRVYSTLSI
jgi:hypothetical protein